MTINDKILERILQSEPRELITLGSTPVISFGDFTTANLATLSINPSSREFAFGGKLLPFGQKRLVDKEVLNIDLASPLQADHAETIWNGCINYFGPSGNPLSWFDELEKVLFGAGRGYSDGSTCHIDLVQWATSPAWSGIPEKVKQQLLIQDFDFFRWQVSQPNIQALVVNGRNPYEALKRTEGFALRDVGTYEYVVRDRKRSSILFDGHGPSGKRVLGWTGALGPMRVSSSERSRVYMHLSGWLAERL